MAVENCRYCTRTTDIMEVVAEFEVSVLYLVKDQSSRGCRILALKEHKTEMFQLSAGEGKSRRSGAIWRKRRRLFMRRLSRTR
jgi:hypothetical protein